MQQITNKNEQKKLTIIHSEEYNPWYNLALEEHLFNNLDEDEIILYLWQNDQTVVIGRNQNSWQECRCSLLEEENGGFLARRLSGGGAVYHDLGNLNFTFILKKKNYDVEKQLEVILKAVRNLGIKAEFTGRNDITVSGKKISGNAFYHSQGTAYHHGTILFDTDIESLVKYLQVSQEKIKSKGIKSVRSRVVNLKEIKEDLTLNSIKEEIEKSFLETYNASLKKVEKIETKPSQIKELEELYNKYSSWDWRYGKTPDFDIYFEKRFEWGGVELGIALIDGKIDQVRVYSDAGNAELFVKINEILKGEKLNKERIISSLDKLKAVGNQDIINDLKQWLAKRDI